MLRAFSRHQPVNDDQTPAVSVVVCARNEEHNLERLIPALCSQDYPHYEVIIVDDRSEDETRQVIRAFQETYSHLRLAKVDHLPANLNGKKYALSIGIMAARKEWILLTDADCFPESDQWIRQMMAGTDTKDFVLGFSMYTPGPGLLNLFIRYETIWTGIHYLGMALAGKPYMGVGRNLAYRRQIFVEQKGFRGYGNVTGGDDDIFVNKHVRPHSASVVIGRDALTWSYPKKTWKEYYRQKLRHLSVGRHYRPATRRLLAVLSLSHIFGYIFMGILLFQPMGWVYSVSGLFIRTLFLLLTFKRTCQKLEIPFSTGKVLPMDLLFAILYPVMGLAATFRKTVRWK
ncbi:glycosyltransferase [Fulvivirga sedimenti]|uniref:Glycosyltransferase n=1 Tax=Fulvivirga sedimenti TaxID=2879465 RepID=A0A9X1HQR3_9BACT|nr:glycosyltransferase [Fulvivirga sedimenti]MCA6075407.1 glycosyltransferase [Fulvivirga sedimenti]MCA6076584.1 glycosyltransferase [Fulvivirga sedimenti]MCA6077712.1 glycosyltransferase [Fulvivirga sedimenti]